LLLLLLRISICHGSLHCLHRPRMSILAVNCFAINCRYLFWIFSIRFSRYVPGFK
jgi:hypothetical protein